MKFSFKTLLPSRKTLAVAGGLLFGMGAHEANAQVAMQQIPKGSDLEAKTISPVYTSLDSYTGAFSFTDASGRKEVGLNFAKDSLLYTVFVKDTYPSYGNNYIDGMDQVIRVRRTDNRINNQDTVKLKAQGFKRNESNFYLDKENGTPSVVLSNVYDKNTARGLSLGNNDVVPTVAVPAKLEEWAAVTHDLGINLSRVPAFMDGQNKLEEEARNKQRLAQGATIK